MIKFINILTMEVDMAIRKVGGMAGVSHHGEEGPKKISSKLAHVVGQTTKAVKKVVMEHGQAKLSGRCTAGAADHTAAGEVARKHLSH